MTLNRNQNRSSSRSLLINRHPCHFAKGLFNFVAPTSMVPLGKLVSRSWGTRPLGPHWGRRNEGSSARRWSALKRVVPGVEDCGRVPSHMGTAFNIVAASESEGRCKSVESMPEAESAERCRRPSFPRILAFHGVRAREGETRRDLGALRIAHGSLGLSNRHLYIGLHGNGELCNKSHTPNAIAAGYAGSRERARASEDRGFSE